MTAFVFMLAHLAAIVTVALFAAAVHCPWSAKERLLARVATWMGVPYEVRPPWWLR